MGVHPLRVRLIEFTAIVAAAVQCVGAQQSPAPAPCPTPVGLLATYFVQGTPNSELARVEIRQCSPEEGYKLQLVAWPSGQSVSPLVVDTPDQVIAQAIAYANIFLIVTTGGPRVLVYVVGFEGGRPKLLVHGVTKSSVEVETSDTAVDLLVREFSAEGEPRHTARYHFKLDWEAMNPPKGTEALLEPPTTAGPTLPSAMLPGAAPMPVKMVSLQYPRLAAAARITGTVVLRARLDKEGMASQVHAVSGPTLLVYAALDNIKLWRFLPARNGVPEAEGEFEFRYAFELKGEADNAHWSSEMTYEYPNKVTVTSKALVLQPDGTAHGEPAHR